MSSEKYWENASKVPSSLIISDMIYPYLLTENVKSVIDLGCGDGELLEKISPYNKVQVGIDINVNSIANATQKNIPNTSFYCLDLLNAPFNQNFDFGILKATLTVIDSLELRLKLLKKFSERVAKYIYISEFLQTPDHLVYFERYKVGLSEIGEVGSFFSNERTYIAHHFTETELNLMLESVGFKIIEKKIDKVSTRSGRIINGIEIIAQRQ